MLPPFEEVVARHGPSVFRVCRAILGAADAEDAWSETFLSALRAYPDLPPDSNVEAWLVTIARRRALDVIRASNRREIPTDELPPIPTTRGLPGSIDTDLWDALATLPLKQREALVYHHIVGMPYAQVGEILGNSEAAARRAAADGLKALRIGYAKEVTT